MANRILDTQQAANTNRILDTQELNGAVVEPPVIPPALVNRFPITRRGARSRRFAK